jgi:DUF4097 and DUF4098 domain-containing protein YvlB
MTYAMRTLIASLAVAAFAVPALAQQKIDVRRAATRDVYVRLNGAFASLKVTGWPKDSLALVGTLPREARFDPAVGGPADGPTRGAKFYIEAPIAAGSTGSLELFVPVGATVWAKSGSAVIDVNGISGGLDLNIVGGSISVSGAPRELNVESMDGSVTVTGSPNWMRVKTATGDISVRGSSTDVGITTVGGTVTLRDGQYERARIEAVTGHVTFGGAISRAGSLVVDSHSGNIDVLVSPKASLDIDATTVTGSITNGLTSRRSTPGREGRGEELTLNLGTGDARATLRSFKGNIRIAR